MAPTIRWSAIFLGKKVFCAKSIVSLFLSNNKLRGLKLIFGHVCWFCAALKFCCPCINSPNLSNPCQSPLGKIVILSFFHDHPSMTKKLYCCMYQEFLLTPATPTPSPQLYLHNITLKKSSLDLMMKYMQSLLKK